MSACPCTSGKMFKACCGRYVFTNQQARNGVCPAKTPEQLMRSRFTAYALGNYGEYLLATWWPATAAGLTAESLSEKTCEWVKLDVLEKNQKGNDGWVSFCAWYLDEAGNSCEMREKSSFKREQGRWFYVSGEFP
ncbi:MAG: hypothetical protein K6L76_03010 [Agarilytica sp.]